VEEELVVDQVMEWQDQLIQVVELVVVMENLVAQE
jgi:hypothetical protein